MVRKMFDTDIVAPEVTAQLNARPELLRSLYPQNRKSSAARWMAPLLTIDAMNTESLVSGQMFLTPLWVPDDGTYDRIGLEVTDAGIGAGTVRIGWYKSNVDGYPRGGLIVQDDTIDGTEVTSHEVAVSVNPGAGLTWLAVVATGWDTYPKVRSAGILPFLMSYTNMAQITENRRYVYTGITGALPADPLTPNYSIGSLPIMGVRRAV